MPADGPSPGAYWAFVSYSSHDRAQARWLQRALETYAIPRRLVGRETQAGPAPKQFKPVFRDRSELPADADLAAKMQAALDASTFLIVVCSPQAAVSRWVNEEIVRFRANHAAGRILAVIVAGHPGGEHQDCFPPALRYRDGAGQPIGPEPIAADLRPGGDRRRLALLKLVAGMLGVGLDELVRRDAQRRARQFGALAAAGFAGMTVMAALAGAALLARNEATRQKDQAEGLIQFMLTDLRKRLEPSGRLDLMDGVGRKALAYYAAQRPEDLDARSLSQRADALRLMGKISEDRGLLPEALVAYQAAAATTAEQLARSPHDGQRVFDHAQSVYYVGEVATQRGQNDIAEMAFKTYLALAQRLARLDPGRDDWRMEGVYANAALGALYLQEGRSPDAVTAFIGALTVAKGVADRHPGDVDDAMGVGQCRAWLADALQKQGRLAAARSQRRAELALYQSLLSHDATLSAPEFSSVVALRALGRIATFGADPASGLPSFEQAAARAEALAKRQPDDMGVTAEAAVAEVDLGDALADAGQLDASAHHQKRAAQLADLAIAHDATVKDWQVYRARARLLGARIDLRRGDAKAALASDQATQSGLPVSGGVNTDSRWLLDLTRVQVGNDQAALGRQMEARASWTAAAEDLKGPLDPLEPRLLAVLRDADQRLGRTAAAKLIKRHLGILASTG